MYLWLIGQTVVAFSHIASEMRIDRGLTKKAIDFCFSFWSTEHVPLYVGFLVVST